ncbi:hypothetical protein [Sphingobacterium lumbrici]|nr:hypothetical protein [Sphingobacterium lumbrici]
MNSIVKYMIFMSLLFVTAISSAQPGKTVVGKIVNEGGKAIPKWRCP